MLGKLQRAHPTLRGHFATAYLVGSNKLRAYLFFIYDQTLLIKATFSWIFLGHPVPQIKTDAPFDQRESKATPQESDKIQNSHNSDLFSKKQSTIFCIRLFYKCLCVCLCVCVCVCVCMCLFVCSVLVVRKLFYKI